MSFSNCSPKLEVYHSRFSPSEVRKYWKVKDRQPGIQAFWSPSRIAGPAAIKIISVQDLGNNWKDIFLPSRLKQASSTEREEKLWYLPLVRTRREGCGGEEHRQDSSGGGNCFLDRGELLCNDSSNSLLWLCCSICTIAGLRAGGNCPSRLESWPLCTQESKSSARASFKAKKIQVANKLVFGMYLGKVIKCQTFPG